MLEERQLLSTSPAAVSPRTAPQSIVLPPPSTYYFVTNANDSGPGSLRNAISAANALTGFAQAIIEFSIGTGPQTINLQSPLPAMTGYTTIDGTTQPGYDPANPLPMITLDGAEISAQTAAAGLSLDAGGVVKGLVIDRFSNAGIFVSGGNNIVTIEGNDIGTDTAGHAGLGNGVGIDVFGPTYIQIGAASPTFRNVISGNRIDGIDIEGPAAQALILGNEIGTDPSGTRALGNGGAGITIASGGCTIGGTSSGSGNVISGNGGNGVVIQPSSGVGNVIEGNLIGTDSSGTMPLGNARNGISVNDGLPTTEPTTIGGTAAGAANVISANHQDGIAVTFQPLLLPQEVGANAPNIPISNGPPAGPLIEGNLIGTDNSGMRPLGNAQDGVFFGPSAFNSSVGGTMAGAANVIAFNGGAGVHLSNQPPTIGPDTGDTTLSNAIYANAGPGIRIDQPLPLLAASPVTLTSVSAAAGAATVSGTLLGAPSTFYTIQLFANDAGDGSGNVQGRQLIGALSVMTNASGAASFSLTLPTALANGQSITATATDSRGNTFEFSNAVTVNSPVATAPEVTSAARSGNRQITILFSEALDSTSARDLAAYRVSVIGRGRRTRLIPIGIRSAVYDHVAHTVTLTVARALPRSQAVQLTVFGTGPHAVRDQAGHPLAGTGGVPGTNAALILPHPDVTPLARHGR